MIGTLPTADLALLVRLVAVLALGAWAARPLALRLVPGGGGWTAAALIAWAVIGWTPWMFAALGLLPFAAGSMSGLVVLAALRALGGRVPGDGRGGLVALGSGVVLIWGGLAQRTRGLDLSGLEKFTDMGFLSASMRSDWMPPLDAWYAGETINYYYVGQAMAAAWGNLIGADPGQAYQLAMAALFALTGFGAFRLTALLAAPFGARIAAVLGAAAAVLTLYGGNFHSALYILFRPWMGARNPDFFYPDSTRYIGFDPETLDRGFTEFPAYAYAVGDLHAHVAATPVFLLGALIVVAMLRRPTVDPLAAAAMGWVLGLLVMVNSWDVAVLGLLASLVALVLALAGRGGALKRLDGLGMAGVIALATAFATAAPFLGAFTPFASGFEWAPAQTPAWQLFVLYSHALLPAALLGLCLWRLPAARAALPVGLVLTAALLLIILPEVVIVKDIYGADFARANTMFKFTFRAQTLLIAGALAALAPAVAQGRLWFAGAMVAAVPLVLTLAYAWHIAASPSQIRGLDGLRFLGDERGLVEAARHLPLAEGESLVEASGNAFGETARVSALTGQRAVLGWAGHQWLWRGSRGAAFGRADRVRTFYQTEDTAARCAVIRRYAIRYAVLGGVEARTYPDLQADAIRALGSPVYSGPGGEIVQIDPSRCP